MLLQVEPLGLAAIRLIPVDRSEIGFLSHCLPSPYMGRLKSSANFMVLPFFVPFVLAIGGDRPTPIDPHESGGGGRSLKDNKATRGGARFKLTMVVKKPTATSLYTVDPLDPNHDATMRIEGEAPKQQQPILFPGAETMG